MKWLFRPPRPAEPEPHGGPVPFCAPAGSAGYHLPDDGEDTGAWAPVRVPGPSELADTVTDLSRKDPAMTDQPDDFGADPDPFAGPGASPTDITPPTWRTDSGTHHVGTDPSGHGEVSQPLTPPSYANDHRPDCRHCLGTGKELTTNDLLRASLELLGDDPRELDRFVAEFYHRLFDVAPYLAHIFPPDLRNPDSDLGGRGKGQRDKLLAALVALGQTYDPDSDDAMQSLNTALAAFGRSHSAFRFPDGVRPANLEEYAAVKTTLMGLFHDAAGERWLPDFDRVWSEAYDYAARRMGGAAWSFLRERGGEVHPRSVRG